MYIYIIIIIFLCLGIIYLIPKHKIDIETQEKNKQLINEHEQLLRQQVEDVTKLGQAREGLAQTEIEIRALEQQKQSLNTDIKNITAQAEATTTEIYKKSYDLMQEHMTQSAEEASKKYKQAEEEVKKEYLTLLQDSQKEYEAKVSEIVIAQSILKEYKEKIQAANQEELRRLAKDNEKDYYKIKISEDELWDIKILKEATKELKGNPLAINKVIWEVYYRKPVTALLNRIAPSGTPIIGIYKVTNLDTTQSYIGQSIDIRSRFRDHIKAGLGINGSENYFYSEMKNIGPEHFMYEIIEECDRSDLNDRERFWIDYFQSNTFGYNSTQGNGNDNKNN